MLTKPIMDDIIDRIHKGESANALARIYSIDPAIISKYRNGKLRSILHEETLQDKIYRYALKSTRFLGKRVLTS